MAKIILINGVMQETNIATFKSDIEAFQAASLFNAILHDGSTYYYIVEYKAKGKVKRTIPDGLRQTVANLSTLYNHLKPIF